MSSLIAYIKLIRIVVIIPDCVNIFFKAMIIDTERKF